MKIKWKSGTYICRIPTSKQLWATLSKDSRNNSTAIRLSFYYFINPYMAPSSVQLFELFVSIIYQIIASFKVQNPWSFNRSVTEFLYHLLPKDYFLEPDNIQWNIKAHQHGHKLRSFQPMTLLKYPKERCYRLLKH